jgi:hypothetical protein
MQRDYNNFDYLSVSVKSEELDKILYCYKILGWKEMRREDDRDDADMKYLTLYRAHLIANKDRLQYLQVRMESLLNSFAAIRTKCHEKSAVGAIITGLFAYLLLAGGLCLLLLLGGALPLIFGIICFVLCAALLVWQMYFLIVVRRKENRVADGEYTKALKELQELIAEAAPLSPRTVSEEEIRQFFGEDRGDMSDKESGGISENNGGDKERGDASEHKGGRV